jgi:hypothetical protein
MSVMAAGMGLARGLGGPAFAGGFEDRQGVHVRPEADHRALSVMALDDADDTRPADTGFNDVAAERLQFVRHELRRMVDIIEQFRILMQMAPPFGYLILHFGDAINNRHCDTPLFFCCFPLVEGEVRRDIETPRALFASLNFLP